MKVALKLSAIVLAGLVPASAAMAQGEQPAASAAAAKPEAGQTIYDSAGAEVGVIKSVDGETFVIDTGSNTATLALSSLGTGDKGPVIGMTKAQLDTAINAAKSDADAAMAAALVPEAPVYASDGATQVATVAAVEEANVVLKTDDGEVGLPKTAVTKGANGLQLGMTAGEFKAAAASAREATPTP